ncbi:GDSL-type esterase/lipase family protein [Amphibacillus xylanus]|nr:GDSL-type esterase/lipase family protein [Amphibacillus xylanus]
MTRRRKIKLFWISMTVILFAIFLFLLLRPNQFNQTTVTEPDQEPIDQVISQVESMDEEVQTATNDLSQTLKEAVEQTINVFTQNDYYITAIGDSLTQGVGDETNRDGYLSTVKRRLSAMDYRVRIDNFGQRGFKTNQVIDRIKEEASVQRSIRRADIILLTVGANDMIKIVRDNILSLNEAIFDEEIDHYQSRLIELFELIQSYNEDVEIFLIGFYNPFEGYFDEVEALEDILNKWNNIGKVTFESYEQGHFIPIHDLFQIDRVNLLANDNFHPNETGYSLIGARVLEEMLPTFELIAQEKKEMMDEQISPQ